MGPQHTPEITPERALEAPGSTPGVHALDLSHQKAPEPIQLDQEAPQVLTDYKAIQGFVDGVKTRPEMRGWDVSFGYIGNLERWGDDRSWMIWALAPDHHGPSNHTHTFQLGVTEKIALDIQHFEEWLANRVKNERPAPPDTIRSFDPSVHFGACEGRGRTAIYQCQVYTWKTPDIRTSTEEGAWVRTRKAKEEDYPHFLASPPSPGKLRWVMADFPHHAEDLKPGDRFIADNLAGEPVAFLYDEAELYDEFASGHGRIITRLWDGATLDLFQMDPTLPLRIVDRDEAMRIADLNRQQEQQ